LIEVETKFPFANSISEFSRSQDPRRTLGAAWSGLVVTLFLLPASVLFAPKMAISKLTQGRSRVQNSSEVATGSLKFFAY
jgi:hypothetical protein